ncbi:MAG: preprotein translocase subunit SecE [Candidatus Paceibacterota bacterium]
MDFANKIITFLKEVKTQLKKVNWLGRKETIKYTAIVIVVSTLVAIFLSSLDFLFNQLLRRFII